MPKNFGPKHYLIGFISGAIISLLAGVIAGWLFNIGYLALLMGNVFVATIALFLWWKVMDKFTEHRYYPDYLGDWMVVIIGLLFFGAVFVFSEAYFTFNNKVVSNTLLAVFGYVLAVMYNLWNAFRE